MKKLSMLAAGVVVLSMCACTEANEFTPSTNNSTKRITEIKVSANPSALGTRTYFNASDANFGVVTWAETDKLHFFKKNTNSNPQVFNCGEEGTQYSKEPNSQYDWNYFKVDKNSTGLEDGADYYAYFFPKEFTLKNTSCETFYVKNENRFSYGGNAQSVLRIFMSEYDLLMSSGSRTTNEMTGFPELTVVHAKKDMDPIYMDHAFALIAVDLNCVGMGKYSDYHQMPYFSTAHLYGYPEDEKINCFANTYEIGSDGQLKFSNSSSKNIESNFDDTYYYYFLTEEGCNKEFTKADNTVHRKISNYTFYFLVHPTQLVKELHIDIETHSRPKENPSNRGNITKSVHLTFSEQVNFVPGNCYRFGLNVDYDPENSYEGNTFNYTIHWKNNPKTMTLASYPTGMKPSNISYD